VRTPSPWRHLSNATKLLSTLLVVAGQVLVGVSILMLLAGGERLGAWEVKVMRWLPIYVSAAPTEKPRNEEFVNLADARFLPPEGVPSL
jgi:hypothetical protein